MSVCFVLINNTLLNFLLSLGFVFRTLVVILVSDILTFVVFVLFVVVCLVFSIIETALGNKSV